MTEMFTVEAPSDRATIGTDPFPGRYVDGPTSGKVCAMPSRPLSYAPLRSTENGKWKKLRHRVEHSLLAEISGFVAAWRTATSQYTC
jgi:hypothetical protein